MAVDTPAVQTFTRQKFEDLKVGPGGRLTDARFDRCSFATPCLYTRPGVFFEAERLEFVNCKVKGRGFSKVICRDIEVQNLKNNPLLQITNSLFDRVTLTGDFGNWFFCWLRDHLSADELAFVERFYAEVPFALDIRAARFKDITLRGVPGELVLRDPASSILVRRATLEQSRDWDAAPGIWPTLLGDFLKMQPRFATMVFVASTLARPEVLEAELGEFEQLRQAGWAE